MQTISHKPTCALGQLLHWLICRNVKSDWQLRLLLSVPAGGEGAASSVAGGQDHGRLVYRRPCQNPVLHRCVTGRLVSGYSLPPPIPPSLSHILDHMALPRAAGDLARGRATRAAGDRRECPLICCLMRPVNSSCWTCSDVRNIGRYNSSRYDTPSIGSDTIPIR